MLAALLLLLLVAPPAFAARLAEFLPRVQPAEIFPDANRIGPPQGEPPLAPAYVGDRLLGQVWLNTDITDATGYSGRPIHMLVAADAEGVIRGIRLVDHKEPIVLIGIPERRIVEALNKLVGATMAPVARGEARPPQVDIVSGATVTVLVMADSVARSAVRLLRAGRLGVAPATGAAPAAAPAPATLLPGPG
jgi:NosR/NirI family nitrous oxide reductase transcriptional regulator